MIDDCECMNLHSFFCKNFDWSKAMNLAETLQEKKKQILTLWIDRTLDSYSSSGFFKKSLDNIANPIGTNIRDGLSKIFDYLLEGADSENFVKPLDQVVRIRAIQDFSPSQAIVPFLELKWVIRQVLNDSNKTKHLVHDLTELDCEIDRLALAAFDKYVECREQLYRVRINELKSGRSILTDTPCSSSMLKKTQADINKIN